MNFLCHINSSLKYTTTPVLLPGKSHGRRSLEGCSPRGRWRLDTTERLHFHFSRSCIGEGNGNPLQCSCLENPRDWGALWAAVYGVAQSWTRLKWLSPSSNSKYTNRNATAGHTVCVILTFNWPFQFVFPCYQLHFNQNTLSELSFSSIFTNT